MTFLFLILKTKVSLSRPLCSETKSFVFTSKPDFALLQSVHKAHSVLWMIELHRNFLSLVSSAGSVLLMLESHFEHSVSAYPSTNNHFPSIHLFSYALIPSGPISSCPRVRHLLANKANLNECVETVHTLLPDATGSQKNTVSTDNCY